MERRGGGDGMGTAKGWMKGEEEERSGTRARNDEGKGRSCRDGKGGGF